jgi:hypothetical protein
MEKDKNTVKTLVIPARSLRESSRLATQMAFLFRGLTTYYDDHRILSTVDREEDEQTYLLRSFLKREGVRTAHTIEGNRPYTWRDIELNDGHHTLACTAEPACQLVSPLITEVMRPFHFKEDGEGERLAKGEDERKERPTWYAFAAPGEKDYVRAVRLADPGRERARIIGCGTDRPVMTLFRGGDFAGVENMGPLTGKEYLTRRRYASDWETDFLDDHFRRLCWGRQEAAEDEIRRQLEHAEKIPRGEGIIKIGYSGI